MSPSVNLNALENQKYFASDVIRNTDRGMCQEISKKNYRKYKEIFYVDKNNSWSLWNIHQYTSKCERSDSERKLKRILLSAIDICSGVRQAILLPFCDMAIKY